MTAAEIEKPSVAFALVAKVRAGELAAVSRLLTELERLSPTAPGLIAEITPDLGRAQVVGFTGPPGAGKSTLVNAFIGALRRAGKTVGVLAVDPSSPITGGALLGDRVRMNDHTDDDGVFIRSIASRGHVGGLTPAAVRMIDGFDAAGKDVVILETVGAGQSEIDVAEVADVRIVLNAPGLGDDIQAMKSGILDIADILVVNKADLSGAEKTYHHLKSAVELSSVKSGTPVLKTVATKGEGIDELAAKAAEIAASRCLTAQERRRRRARRLLAWAAAALIERRVMGERDAAMDRLCDEILSGLMTPDAAAQSLLKSD